ncbi:unnamed protein product, partial [Brassica oleracea var. botrytis]
EICSSSSGFVLRSCSSARGFVGQACSSAAFDWQYSRIPHGNRGFPATVVNRLFPRGPRHSTYFWDLTLARVANANRTCGERIGSV